MEYIPKHGIVELQFVYLLLCQMLSSLFPLYLFQLHIAPHSLKTCSDFIMFSNLLVCHVLTVLFNCIYLLSIYEIEDIFIFIRHLNFSCYEVRFQVLYPYLYLSFFFLLLIDQYALYILDTEYLHVMLISNVFCHFSLCSFGKEGSQEWQYKCCRPFLKSK